MIFFFLSQTLSSFFNYALLFYYVENYESIMYAVLASLATNPEQYSSFSHIAGRVSAVAKHKGPVKYSNKVAYSICN